MSSRNGNERPLSVGIVGAGFGGVGMGIRLKQAGVDEFTIFERGESVGGVWRANTYPGAACDVPSHIYSFSFAPGHRWSRRFAPGPEIKRYLEEVTREYGIEPHLRLGEEVTQAEFDADRGRWALTTDGGEKHEFDLLVTACGQSTRPKIPRINGLDDFGGRAFHSAEWDHDHDLSGRNVAVIGTGASAIQFVPRIAPVVERLTIYQRSAPWVLPKSDREYPEWEQRLFRRFPIRVQASRFGLFSLFEAFTYAFTGQDWVMKPLEMLANRERARQISDPELRALTTPDYRMGCKRVLITSDWYPTLMRSNVELLNGGVEKVTPAGVVAADGVEREADTIIFGTGFQSHNFVAPLRISGVGGTELNTVWKENPFAYLGITVSGFPNMFVMYGPTTNHGSGSAPYTLECQFNYVIDAIDRLRRGRLRFIDLRPDKQEEWKREMADRSRKTVWVTGGCGSWYINERGENVNNWPGAWLEYRRRTRRINPAHYRAVAA